MTVLRVWRSGPVRAVRRTLVGRWLTALLALLWLGWLAPLHHDDPARAPGKKAGAKPLPVRTDGLPSVVDGSIVPPAIPAGGSHLTPGGTPMRFIRGNSGSSSPLEPIHVRPPILDGAIEALENALAGFEPENGNGELSAMAAMQLLQELAAFGERAGAATTRAGERIRERVYMTPAAGDAVVQVGAYMAAPKEDIQTSVQVIVTEHDDDFRRIGIDDEGAQAWDWRPNRVS